MPEPDQQHQSAPIGIVVNPRAGTDVRRATAAATRVTLEEKINVVRRVVLGARESGACRFVVHHDPHRIVRRATDTIRGIQLEWVGGPVSGSEQDAVDAVRAMREAGCAVVVVLGGDGTNRAAALAWPDLVVVPLSTGTNNAFPVFVEATVAGAAAGHLAVGRVPVDEAAPRAKVVRLRLEGEPEGSSDELALVDAVAVDDPFVGSLELFDPATLRLAVLSRADPAVVGFSGVGGLLDPVSPDEDAGLLVRFGLVGGCQRVLRGPTAPGHYEDLGIAEVRRLVLGEEVVIEGPRGVVGDVDGPAAEGEHGQDVGGHRVADHHEVRGVDTEAVEHAGVGGLILLGHYLDPPEPVGQAAPSHFGHLVVQVPLGDDQKAVGTREGVDGVGDSIQ